MDALSAALVRLIKGPHEATGIACGLGWTVREEKGNRQRSCRGNFAEHG
jgi:hypothetical protein